MTESRSALAMAQVQKALAESKLDVATELACNALDSGLETALFLNLRAFKLEQHGDFDHALADLRRAGSLAPNDYALHNSLGLCLARLGRLREAIGCFDTSISLESQFAAAYYNKAWALEDLGELDAARKSYEQAASLAENPAFALGRLAGLAARRADWTSVRSLTDRALVSDPSNPAALLARTSADIHDKRFAEAEKQMRQLAAVQGLDGLDRAKALTLLGDVLEAQKHFAQAFDAYTEANSGVRQFYSRFYERSGQASMQVHLDHLIAYFENLDPSGWPAFPQAAQAGAGQATGHVFLLGFPRSGTTLLEEVLAGNPLVEASGERDPLAAIANDYMGPAADIDRLATAADAQLDIARKAYWEQAERLGLNVAGKTFIDKLPYNTIYLPLISRLFPTAKILFALRDPRDVVLSCYKQLFRMNVTNYEFLTLEGTARTYDKVMRLMNIYRHILPLQVCQARHEDIVGNPESEMQRVCEFADISWTSEMLDFVHRVKTRPISTPSAPQLAQGLSRTGIARWRSYADQLTSVLPILEPWVAKFGYEA